MFISGRYFATLSACSHTIKCNEPSAPLTSNPYQPDDITTIYSTILCAGCSNVNILVTAMSTSDVPAVDLDVMAVLYHYMIRILGRPDYTELSVEDEPEYTDQIRDLVEKALENRNAVNHVREDRQNLLFTWESAYLYFDRVSEEGRQDEEYYRNPATDETLGRERMERIRRYEGIMVQAIILREALIREMGQLILRNSDNNELVLAVAEESDALSELTNKARAILSLSFEIVRSQCQRGKVMAFLITEEDMEDPLTTGTPSPSS
ncbi:hypothetical protein F5Y19DRAFT_60095 [Xylariaceae sp. FL1651]|nr:hypothetical protein F5Y19DRAFT_60095 [Xylariaceae sp. FL1651]